MEPFEITVDEGVAATLSKALQLAGFFPEFTAAEAAKVFPRSALWFYPDRRVIIAQGEAGRDLFVVVSGSVTVSKTVGESGGEIATLGAGQLFGEIALVQGGQRRASVVARGDCQVFHLVFEDLSYLLNNHKELAEHLKALAYRRLFDK